MMTPIATLEETLEEAVATGKLGTVVSVRALLHLPGEEPDLETAASVLLSLSGRLVGSDPGSLVVRGHGSGRQLNLLLRLDAGPIVIQGRIPVHTDDTTETLAQRVHEVEYRIYPQAIRWFAEGRLKLRDDSACLDGYPVRP